jgi:hypothetical protein
VSTLNRNPGCSWVWFKIKSERSVTVGRSGRNHHDVYDVVGMSWDTRNLESRSSLDLDLFPLRIDRMDLSLVNMIALGTSSFLGDVRERMNAGSLKSLRGGLVSDKFKFN